MGNVRAGGSTMHFSNINDCSWKLADVETETGLEYTLEVSGSGMGVSICNGIINKLQFNIVQPIVCEGHAECVVQLKNQNIQYIALGGYDRAKEKELTYYGVRVSGDIICSCCDEPVVITKMEGAMFMGNHFVYEQLTLEDEKPTS